MAGASNFEQDFLREHARLENRIALSVYQKSVSLTVLTENIGFWAVTCFQRFKIKLVIQ